jgi:hypothetical protein
MDTELNDFPSYAQLDARCYCEEKEKEEEEAR